MQSSQHWLSLDFLSINIFYDKLHFHYIAASYSLYSMLSTTMTTRMFERKDIKDDIYILWFPSFHTPHRRMISLRGVMIKCQNRTDLLSQKPLKKEKKKWQSWRLCEEINFHIYLHIFSPWSYTCMTMQTVLCFNPLASLLGVEKYGNFLWVCCKANIYVDHANN